jgi:hypothetical protein
MFPNSVMLNPQTWNHILAAMVSVRDAHGWNETAATPVKKTAATLPARISGRRSKAAAGRAARVVKRSAKPKRVKKTAKAKAKPARKKTPAKRKAKKSGRRAPVRSAKKTMKRR